MGEASLHINVSLHANYELHILVRCVDETYEVTHPSSTPRPAVAVEHAVHDGVGAGVGAREQPHGLLDGRVQAGQRLFVDPVPGDQRECN